MSDLCAPRAGCLEYVLRLRERDGAYHATLRQVAPHSILDAPPRAGTVDAFGTANTAPAAMVAAIASAHIPAGRFQPLDAVNLTYRSPEPPEAPQTARIAPTAPRPSWSLASELCLYWPAWQEIVGYVAMGRPDVVDPHDIHGAACGVPFDRLAALLFANYQGETLAESAAILTELLDAARDGHRPRCGRELGLTPEMFDGSGERL